MARLQLSVLGGFHAAVDGTPLHGFDTDKTRALLTYLGVEAGHPHGREALAGLLWPEFPEEAARRNLRNSLFKLRQALGEDDGAQRFLLVTAKTVQIDPSADYVVDVAAFTRLIAACGAHRHRHRERCATCHIRLEQAAALYRGDFLTSFHLADCAAFEEWLVLKRERLHREALDALGRLATYHEGRAEYAPALAYTFRQLELDPWREEAYRQAMRLLVLTGQPSAALAQYEACWQALAAELHAEPSAETTALYERVKAHDGPTVLTSQTVATRHNLPRQLTPFIGRTDELRRIIERLDSPDYGLITVVGPGGVGKTRLALQAATEQIGAFADGVYWVALAAIGSADLLYSSIAQAIGFHFETEEHPEGQLLNHLRDKELLLVLDNFEQLQTGGAATDQLLALLTSAPRLNMLITSRERLGLHAEFLLDLAGLPLPQGPGVLTGSGGGQGRPAASPVLPAPAELMASSAVQLFVERAQQANPTFILAQDTGPGVVEICRLVAGLPLGLVLAGAWVRYYTPAKIAASIQANLDFLTSPARDAAPQHTSLRAVFNYSWALLDAEEQRIFRRLPVFRSGWDAEAAVQVAGAALPALLALVDKSLLRHDPAGRFDVHDVLRQYAAEKLQEEPEEQAQVRLDHARYYLALAEQAEVGLQSEAQDQWLARLEQEHDNLRAVLRWTEETAHVAWGLRLGAALSRFWFVRGYYREGRAALAAVLALRPPPAPDPAQASVPGYRAKALQAAGDLARAQGDYPAARALCTESLAIYRKLGRPQDIAIALNRLGIVAWNQDEHALARMLYEESLGISRELGDQKHLALTMGNLGTMAFVDGDYAAAHALLEESISLCRELGDTFNLAIRLNNLGNVALLQDDYAAARRLHAEGLALRRELGDQWGIAVSLVGLGGAAVGMAAPERGTRVLGAATALLEAIGARLEADDLIPYERGIAVARRHLDATEFARAWAAGSALPLEQALSQALQD